MAKHKRTIDPALLPHARPCWCADCKREYHRLWWQTGDNGKRYKVSYLHSCVMCPKTFTTQSRKSSFCSDKCRGASVVRIGFCVEDGCGKSYPRKGKRRRCDEHVKRAWQPGPARLEVCRGCLNVFSPQPGRLTQVCCSTKCWNDLKTQMRWFSRWDACDLPLCCVCDKPTFKGRGSCVCAKCKNRFNTEARLFSGANNLKNARRRSATRDGDVGITVAALRDRDGDFCRACGFKIDFDAAQYDDLAPEIDHIVPLAHEGTHTWGNVQLLHGRCNRSKGVRLIPDRPTLFDEDIA